MAKKKFDVSMILIVVGLLIIGYFLVVGSGIGTDPNTKKVSCEITIDNDIITKADITQTSCSTSKCSFIDSFSSGTYGIISQNFQVVINVGGVSKTNQISLRNDPFGDEETLTMSLCVDNSETSGTVKVFNSAGVLQDTANVNF